MIITNIKGNEIKIKEWNQNLEKMKIDMPDRDWDKLYIKDINDKLQPYSIWKNRLNEAISNGEDISIVEDTRDVSNKVIVSLGSSSSNIKLFTDLTIKRNDGFDDVYYGVCDNAEQLLNYYDNKINSGELNSESKYLLCLTPIFKFSQPPVDGWRWHKHGEYIGVQNPKCEYLYNEDIDLVYSFSVIEIL